MPDAIFDPAITVRPVSQPTCCPDAYLCLAGGRFEIECPRHGGFDVCCDQPDRHVQQDPKVWHEEMYLWEQELLNGLIRLQMFEQQAKKALAEPRKLIILP